MGITEGIIVIILAGLAVAILVYYLKIPPILGYIISGVMIGPHGANLVSDVETIELLAEIGVILLLFSIGLSFSLKELKRVKNIALYGTPLQILVVIAMGYGIGAFLKISAGESFVLGAAASLSSTMIVIKLLMSQKLMGTLSSRVMIGILIAQDLAAVPLMIIIPQINNLQGGLPVLGMVAVKAVVFLLLIFFLGTKLFPSLLRIIARWDSRELFLLTITALALGVGYLTYLAGLSFAFGAFIAGMVLSESEYSHQALNDIIPLRDVFGLLFFSGIGMLFDPLFAWNHITAVLSISLMVLMGKAIILSSISRAFGYINIVPIATGLGLAQIGEFSFVLAGVALKENVISHEVYSIILSTAIVTMMVSPVLARLAVPLYELKKKRQKNNTIAESYNTDDENIKEHIVIVGGGRVGSFVASVLFVFHHRFILIENNFPRFELVKEKGYPVIFGDGSNTSVLEAAHIERAKLLLITIPDIIATRLTVDFTKKLSPNIHVIARAENREAMEVLRKKEVFEVVLPEFEASLEIIRQALLHMNEPITNVQNYTDQLRKNSAGNKYKVNDVSQVMKHFKNASHLLDIEWFFLEKNSSIANKTLADASIRSETGVSVVGILHNEEFIPNPLPNLVLREKDYIAIIGTAQAKEKFHKWVGE